MKTNSINAKRRKTIPVYVFDEHNEAYYFWHKAKYEGFIEKPLDFFHIDAHNDMGRVERFTKSIYFPDHSGIHYLEYYRDFTRRELNIGNFIFPAILNALVNKVYFIYPKWRNSRPHRMRMSVCAAFGEGKVLKYGVKADSNHDPRISKAFHDLRHFSFSMSRVEGIPRSRKVILDIDLDYFACVESITNHMRYELEITEEQCLKRKLFVSDRTLPFSRLDFRFSEKDKRFYVSVAQMKRKEASHLPPRQEIASEINTLVETLQLKKIKPAVVTISRSCISGRCPKDYYEFIETTLMDKLAAFLQHCSRA